MALQNRLELKLSQKLILTRQLQMAIKLLQMPQLELSQTLTAELTENPFLEETVDNMSVDDLSSEEKESLEQTDDDRDDSELPLDGLARMMTKRRSLPVGSRWSLISFVDVVAPPRP